MLFRSVSELVGSNEKRRNILKQDSNKSAKNLYAPETWCGYFVAESSVNVHGVTHALADLL